MKIRALGIIAILAVLVGFLAPQAQAGTSYIYLQACQGEGGASTPATPVTSTDASNGQPYCVMDFTLTTADTAYYHFVIPNDFSATNSTGATSFTLTAFPETETVSGRVACFRASVGVFSTGANYRTAAIPTGTNLGTLTSVGQYVSTGAAGSSFSYTDLSTGAACAGTSCNNRQAVMKLERYACPGGTAITGAVGLTSVYLAYQN